MASPSQAAIPALLRLAGHPLRWRLLTELARSDLRVRELVTSTGEPQNLVSYHLRVLRDGGLVTATRSSFDGRDSYYHLDLARCADALTTTGAALHPALGPTQPPALGTDPPPAFSTDPPPAFSTDPPPALGTASPVSVLFVCTGNSARSPIAAALLRRHAAGTVDTTSAGTAPKPGLHPDAVRVLHDEYGVGVSPGRPRHLNTLTGRRFDYLITLCDKAREVCPAMVDHVHRAHWSIPDPALASAATTSYPAFARAAADIDTRIRYLLPALTASNREEDQP